MTLSHATGALTDLAADLLVLPVRPGEVPGEWRAAFGDPLDAAAADATQTKDPSLVYTGGTAARVAVVPVGDPEELDARRVAAAKAAQLAQRLRASTLAFAIPEDEAGEAVGAYVEGVFLGAYRYVRYRTRQADLWTAPEHLLLHGAERHEEAIRRAVVGAEVTNLARDLVNLSPDEKTPELLAALVREAAEAAGLRVDVWDHAKIREERMGGLLAINRGSLDPPAFVVIEHRPEGPEDQRPVVLVGKAVTFDTGGLSLKPTPDSMDQMKADMAGGAAVAGAIIAAARLGLDRPVVALIPMTDNRPGERAVVPGDVVRMRSGATVEVLNTDAEGRMILADALDVARGYDPVLVVSVATLTGAQVIALGSRVAAVLTNEDEGADDRLARFKEAGVRTGDFVAPLPLFAFFEEYLESDVADLKNIGGREAGTITAAKFLEHFTRDADGRGYPWVHLDIAGPAFLKTAKGYRPKGGTGFGVRLLLDVLMQPAA